MPIQALLLGPTNTLTQNVTYALPGTLCLVTSSGPVETSLDGTTWAAHTSGELSGAAFIRSSGVNTIVICK